LQEENDKNFEVIPTLMDFFQFFEKTFIKNFFLLLLEKKDEKYEEQRYLFK
jgi:hypothetical protein